MASIVSFSTSCPFLDSHISCRIRYERSDSCLGGSGKVKKNKYPITMIGLEKKRKWSFCTQACSDVPPKENSSTPNLYQEIRKAARDKFTKAISDDVKDEDISLPRVLLYIAAEDEALIAFNREADELLLPSERRDTSALSTSQNWDSLETMLLAGKNINEWLKELETIVEEIKAQLISRNIDSYLTVLKAVNLIFFESRGFKRPVKRDVDPKCSYLHSVLGSRCGSGILLSVIYIEVCRRLDLTILGSRVGEEFLIWPQTGNPEELFIVTEGQTQSLFRLVNGSFVQDPRARASDICSKSLLELDIATKRDMIGISLADLIRVYWKLASQASPGLMLTTPLRPIRVKDKLPVLRPHDLRFAIMAVERLKILQPRNWVLRREHGMLLYYSREYQAALQEIAICMAIAPHNEVLVMQPFVDRLHLLCMELSWKSSGSKGGPLSIS